MVTFFGGCPSVVVNVTVTVLLSGSGSTGKFSTLFVFGGDVLSSKTVPFGAMTRTLIWLTFVFVLGTETEATIGVIAGASGMIAVAFGSSKLTPGEPGFN